MRKRPARRVTAVSSEDEATIHRDRRRLLGDMAKMIDYALEEPDEAEQEAREILIDLGLPEGSPPHEERLRNWWAAVAEKRAELRRSKKQRR